MHFCIEHTNRLCLQDIMLSAEPLSGNLHELAENVKRLADRLLKGKAAAVEAQQLTTELAGGPYTLVYCGVC